MEKYSYCYEGGKNISLILNLGCKTRSFKRHSFIADMLEIQNQVVQDPQE